MKNKNLFAKKSTIIIVDFFFYIQYNCCYAQENYMKKTFLILITTLFSITTFAAGIDVCAPPNCIMPVLITKSTSISSVIYDVLMAMTIVCAWLFVNGITWFFGFFPKRPIPFYIKSNPQYLQYWNTYQKEAQKEINLWKSDPYLINLRRKIGIKLFISSILITTMVFTIANKITINPAGFLFSEQSFENGKIKDDQRFIFNKDGKVLTLDGKEYAKWTANANKTVVYNKQEQTTLCYFWNDSLSEMWLFDSNCPTYSAISSEESTIKPIKRMVILDKINDEKKEQNYIYKS